MSDEVDKMVSGIKSLATPLQDLILREAMDDREYANKAAAELAALRVRVERLEAAGVALFQACADLPLPEMDRMENEINAMSAALKA